MKNYRPPNFMHEIKKQGEIPQKCHVASILIPKMDPIYSDPWNFDPDKNPHHFESQRKALSNLPNEEKNNNKQNALKTSCKRESLGSMEMGTSQRWESFPPNSENPKKNNVAQLLITFI